ncbi:FRAS1-related extracellular matrix protein 2-like [Amphiura filiformis]|uniref:FRAS1-related extracellular matrix protein 2-like n=1 Tax=Amphiura filiformis TaxID=82378 RepID=UPI003B21F15C
MLVGCQYFAMKKVKKKTFCVTNMSLSWMIVILCLLDAAHTQITWYFLDCNDYYVDEAAGTVNIILKRRGDLSVATSTTLTATDLSAAVVMDYGALTAMTDLIFAAGEDEKTVILAITDDTSQEHTEQLMVEIGFSNAVTAASAGQALQEPLHKATVTIDDDDSPVTWYFLDCNDYYVDEATGTLNVDVRRRGDLSVSQAITLTATDLSATSTMDYGTLAAVTDLIFLATEHTKTVTLPITDDGSEEHTEQLMVAIGLDNAATAATNGQALLEPLHKATVTIEDDDSPITWYFMDCNDYYVDEATGTLNVDVRRRGDLSVLQPITLTLTDLSATSTMDYGTLTPATDLVFAANEDMKTVALTITNDNSQEHTEQLMVEIGFTYAAAAAAAGQALLEPLHKATVTIDDDDSPITWYFLDCNDYYVDEATGTLNVDVRRRGDLSVSQAITLTAWDRSATSTMDYGVLTPVTDLTFAATEYTKTAALAITDDDSQEHTEQLVVEIGFDNAVTAATNGQALLEPLHKATVTIEDEDTIFWIQEFQYVEKEGNTVVVTVHRRGNLANGDTVTLTSTGDTATATDYYSSPTGAAETVTFAAGDKTGTVTYTLATDEECEDLEKFTLALTLSGTTDTNDAAVVGSPSTSTVYIVDCTALFWIQEFQYVEKEGNTLVVTVHRRGNLANGDTVTLTSTDYTATAIDDYWSPYAAAETVTFAAGDKTGTVTYSLATDDECEDLEKFTLALTLIGTTDTNNFAVVGSPGTSTVYIVDCTAIFWIQEFQYTVKENHDLVVTVHRRGNIANADTVILTSRDGTATFSDTAGTDDFTSTNMMEAETVTFAAGVKTATVTYSINRDTVIEDFETFTLLLELAGTTYTDYAAAVGSPSTSTVYIVDCTATINMMPDVYTIPESVGTFGIFIQRHGDVSTSLNIELIITDVSAEIPTDFIFTAPVNTTFQPGQSTAQYKFTIIDDMVLEDHEYFRVAIDRSSILSVL